MPTRFKSAAKAVATPDLRASFLVAKRLRQHTPKAKKGNVTHMT